MRRFSVLLAVTLLLASCTHLSIAERYQRNKSNVHLSARARTQLSKADVDQIARLIAQDTPKQLLAISKLSERDYPKGMWDITVGDPNGTEHYQFGFYHLAKESHVWRIAEKFDSLSPSLVGLGWDDVKD